MAIRAPDGANKSRKLLPLRLLLPKKLYQGAVIKKQPSTCDHLQRQNVLFTKSVYLPLLNPGKIESVGGKSCGNKYLVERMQSSIQQTPYR